MLAVADFGTRRAGGGWTGIRGSWPTSPVTAGADIVGFGDAGVYVALSNGDGTFQPPRFVVADFGYEAGAGGSTSIRGSWPT